MPDERARTEQMSSAYLPPPADGPTPPSLYERIINWAAGLPWWAIILIVVAVVVVYSMLTSTAYRRVIESLADDPQISTNDKYDVVQIVGEEKTITGEFIGMSADSPETITDTFLDDVVDNEQVERLGFLAEEKIVAVTVRTADGLAIIPYTMIKDPGVLNVPPGSEITLTYKDRVTVTGTMTGEDDDYMNVRTVDEDKETFATSRILSRSDCDPASPGCDEGEVTFLRQGEIITGTLKTLSNTNLSVELDGGGMREIRRSDIDYFNVPTLTIALHLPSARAGGIQTGDEVKIGFVEGSDIAGVLDKFDVTKPIPVPLSFTEGEISVLLTPYPDLEAALQATSTGEVIILIYLDDGPDRLAVQQWVEANEDAGVVLARPPAECGRDCEVTVKLRDDELTGKIAEETADQITIVTTPAEFVVLDKDDIVENRRKEPAVCALNNISGCDAGLFLTLRVSFLAYGLAVLIGLVVGLMRVQVNSVAYAVSTLYVEVVRGIPLLVILLYAGFVVGPELRDGLKLIDLHWLSDALPDFSFTIKIDLGLEKLAILGLAFGYGAFIAEIFRAGIQSISRGQMEAARSLGMSYPQAMRFVVLPQAVRVVLPPLGNDFISMLKDSALISVLALPDLLQLGRLYVSRTFRAFEGYNTVAILYLAMTLFLSMLVRVIERRSRLPR